MSIFISHATADDAFVDRLYDRLSTAGLNPWADHKHGLSPGDDWSKGIHDAVNDCTAAIFVMSPRSVKSSYCEAEWQRVLALNKMLYPVVIEAVPTPDIPLRLGTIQYVNLAQDFEAGMAELIDALQKRRAVSAGSGVVGMPLKLSDRSFARYQLDYPLTGRDEEFAKLQEDLAAHRLVIVTGIGGVGKTRLAAEMTVTSAARFPDGVVWLTLDKLATPDHLADLIRSHLNLSPELDRNAIWREMGRYKLLVMLDNGETCSQPAAFADAIATIETAGGTRVLMTSRNRWPELRNPRQLPLAEPDFDRAKAIFEVMVEKKAPAFLPNGHTDAMVEAARQHPRLMEHAVDWLHAFPPDYVLEQLVDLKGDDVEAALQDIIQRTLTQIEARPGGLAALVALQRLTVFRGGFTFDAARALLDDVAPLKMLLNWGMVRLEAGRYEVPPLVIDAVGTDDSAHRPHYDFYKALAEEHNQKQDYLGLDAESLNLEAAFEWALGVDANDAYRLAEACRAFNANRGRFAQNIAWMERVAPEVTGERNRAAVQVGLGTVYSDTPRGNRRENLMRAIRHYEAALAYYTPKRNFQNYAVTQNNLGTAYLELARIGNRAENLHQAIQCYEAALEYYTPQAAPLDYAMTQNNLGATYLDLAGTENRAENLRRAIRCFEATLEYYTPQATPLSYATMQNNLGVAYWNLSEIENRAENLRRAVGCLESALEYHTAETAPLAYALTQNNLGEAYRQLAGVENRTENLRRAIECCEAALEYYTPEVAPLGYAATLNNLGVVYWNLSEIENRTENLRRAIGCFEAALEYHTSAPLVYAQTQNNLGEAYRQLASIEDRAENLRRAIECCEAALEYYTPEVAPLGYAGTQNNLGLVYWNLSEIENEAENLHRAIECFEAALKYRTPQIAPLDYAQTQNSMAAVYLNLAGVENQAGNIYHTLVGVENRVENLHRAIECFEAALKYRTPQIAPLDYARTQNNMAAVYLNLAGVENQAENLRRAISCCEIALEYVTPQVAPLDYAMIQRNLGIALKDSGNIAGAVRGWREAETYYRKMGHVAEADSMLQLIEKAGNNDTLPMKAQIVFWTVVLAIAYALAWGIGQLLSVPIWAVCGVEFVLMAVLILVAGRDTQ